MSYSVIVTSRGDGNCSAAESITLDRQLTASAGADKTICAGESTMLTATGGASYSWSTGTTASSIIVTPVTNAIYTVTVSTGSCTEIDTVQVFVQQPNAGVISGNDTITLHQSEPYFVPAIPGYSYSWSISSGGSIHSGQGTPSVTAAWSNSGTAQLRLVVSSQGCSNTVSKDIVVSNLLTISGVIHSEIGSPIRSATVSLTDFTGSEIQNFTTPDTGFYSFDVTPGYGYNVKPSKSNDVTTANGITTLDLLLIRKQILAMENLNSPYKIIASDVNRSDTVTTIDIILIRRIILGTALTFPNGGLWEFVRSDFVFSNPLNPFPFDTARRYDNISMPQTNQNFIGIKLGDVNNSWDPNTPKLGAIGDMRFMMDEHYARPGDVVIVPVKAEDFRDIAGYQFSITWDAHVLEYKGIEQCELSCYYGEHLAKEGMVSILWTDEAGGSASLPDGSNLLGIRFKLIGEVGDESFVRITSDITPVEAVNANLLLVGVETEAGKVGITNEIRVAEGVEFTVFPNPTSGTITIKSNSLDTDGISGETRLKVYNTVGKLLINHEVSAQALEQGVTLDLKDAAGNIFFLRITNGKHTQEIKVLKNE